MFWIQSTDVEVKNAAALALAHRSYDKDSAMAIMNLGAPEHLVELMLNLNDDAQRCAVKCVQRLTEHAVVVGKLATSEVMEVLISLARSRDATVQQHATAALFNMTISRDIRQMIIDAGASSVFVNLLK
ncbi:hypothetical protein BG011_007822 [Mortierella polycephala]|uniref:Vacuolar protein 8 n=1 Tax=Mortierella polycephala TaxID=41804 RepID=A0A9P6PSE9_9FUNG|nr:hypothetical protein BG011_007822 [Mortierella polycephala]